MNLNIKNLIALAIAFILSIGLVIGGYMVFNPIKEAKDKAVILDKVETLFADATEFTVNPNETIDGVEILLSLKVLDGTTPLGYIYEANTVNGFGNIKIIISVGLDERIIEVVVQELNQTMYQSNTLSLAQNYVFQKLSGSIPDANSGATSVSAWSLMDMMQAIGAHHDKIDKFEIILPYQAFYGEGYQVIDTKTSNVDGAVVKTETISGNLGTVYSLTKAGIYNTDLVTTKEITVVVVLDDAGKILGVLLPPESYNHTKGNFYNNALEFSQSYVDLNLSDIVDGQAGSTADPGAFNSRSLIEDLMLIAKGVYLG